MDNYKTSKDYEKLYRLIYDGQSVICIIKHSVERRILDAVITVKLINKGKEYERIIGGSIGCQFIDLYTQFDETTLECFTKECEAKMLEYIEPNI